MLLSKRRVKSHTVKNPSLLAFASLVPECEALESPHNPTNHSHIIYFQAIWQLSLAVIEIFS